MTLRITVHPIDLPKDLDAYITERESLIPNIRPDCHKRILWADKKHRKTEYAIIYLHSFTGSPRELKPLIEQLGRSFDANIFYQRLEGHGQGRDDLDHVNLNHWINNTWEAWEIGSRIGKKLIVISTSTGSALATWLCARVGNIHACIMISPNFMPKNFMIRFLGVPGMIKIVETLKGRYAKYKHINNKNSQYFTTTYPRRAWIPMYRACLLANRMRFREIRIPLLILYTKWDKLISSTRIENIFSKWGSIQKSLIDFPDTQEHFLAGEIFSPEKSDEVRFLIEHFIHQIRFI